MAFSRSNARVLFVRTFSYTDPMRSGLGLSLVTLFLLVTAACGSDTATIASELGSGVRVVSPEEGAQLVSNSSNDPVIIDVRTPAEFAEGRVEGAVLIDFYESDFADRIAELDRSGSYVIYCRSGNRSSQARNLMADLGFVDVADIDGGIVGWVEAGLPLVR